MKKLFFLVAAIALGWLSSSAEKHTYANWPTFLGYSLGEATLNAGQEYTSADGNFKIQFSAGATIYGSSYSYALQAATGTFTITAVDGNLKSINFGSMYYTNSQAAFESVSSGEMTFNGAPVWTGDAKSITITTQSPYFYTASLEIETGAGGGTVDPDPDPNPDPDPEPADKTFSYADYVAFFNTGNTPMTLTSGQEYTSADGNFKVKYEGSQTATVSQYGMLSVKGGTFTITAVNGNMKSIDFGSVYLSYNKKALTGVSTGALDLSSTTLWTGDAQSVTFTIDETNPLYTYELNIVTGEGGGDTPVDPVEKPEVSFDWDGKTQYSGNTVSFSACPANQVINFKAKNLKGDITLVCTSNITPATTTITKAQAEAADGFDVNFYFDPKVKGEDATVTVKTEGMDDAVLSFSSLYAKMTVTIDDFSGITGAGDYIYKGEGLVTYHQTKGLGTWSGGSYPEIDVNDWFIEDAKGAIKLTIPEDIAATMAVGDKVSNFKIKVAGYSKKAYTYTLVDNAPAVVSSGNAVEPMEIALADMDNYYNRFVTIKNVTSTSAGKTFTSAGSMMNLTQNGVTKTYIWRIFPGTDMINFKVPEGEFNITGLNYQGYIYPRTTADVVTAGTPVEAPELTLENALRPGYAIEQILLSGYAPMVKNVIVKGKNLTGDVTISCDNESITFDKTTLAKADVESEAGATVAITINPAESCAFNDVVKFATAGLETAKELKLYTYDNNLVNVIKKVDKLSDVINKAGTYQVNDAVTVTYSNWDMYYAYAQNADVALRLDVSSINYGAPTDMVLKAGDEIKNFFLVISAPTEWEPNWTYAIKTTNPTTGLPDSYGENRHFYDFVSRDNVVTPEVITLDQAAARANRLVKVTGVEFQNLTDGQKFELSDGAEEWMPKEPTAYAVKAGGKDGFVKPFDGEIYGTEIPTGAVSVTGIAAADATVMPYNLACIEAGAPVGDAELNLSTTTIAMTGQKMPCERKVVLTGKGLTGDVTVKCPEGVTATPATVAAADINAAGTEGVEVTLTFDIAAKTFEGTVEFECADLDAPKTIAVTGAALIPQLRAEDVAGVKALGQDGNVIMLTGEATVTYVVKNNDGKVTSFYMQDENRAMLVDTEGLLMMGKDFPQPAIGDKLKDVVVSPYDGDFSLIANGLGQYLTIVSSGNTVATKKVAGEAALTEEDEYMLLEVENARFDVPEGTTVLEEGGLYTLKSATGEITVNPFKTANGTAIPDSRVNVIGIYAPDSSIPGYLVLRPRTSADVTTSAAGDVPTAIVTRTFYDPKAIAVGETATIAQYTVEVDNLTADGTVTFEGEGADQFTAEPATISKEKGKKTLTVKFTPKATGTFDVKMNINFGVEELNQSLELTGKAYDPANLPEVTLSEYKLQLNAKVGETATQKVMMTMKNCFAPVTITAKDAENTSVTLNTMSVEPSAEPFELVVTYAPTAEGQGTQMFDITTDQIKTVAVLVVNFSTDNSIAIVPADADGYYRVYNTNGVMLLETRDASRLAELTPGLYIINGKKVIIR